MVTFTQAQYDALTEAIALGAYSIQFNGKMTNFRSLDEMLALQQKMAVQLGISKKRTRVNTPTTLGYGAN